MGKKREENELKQPTRRCRTDESRKAKERTLNSTVYWKMGVARMLKGKWLHVTVVWRPNLRPGVAGLETTFLTSLSGVRPVNQK